MPEEIERLRTALQGTGWVVIRSEVWHGSVQITIAHPDSHTQMIASSTGYKIGMKTADRHVWKEAVDKAIGFSRDFKQGYPCERNKLIGTGR